MKTRFIMLVILAMSLILFAGCGPPISLNPFYTDKDVIFDESFLGDWIDENEYHGSDGSTWKFINDGKEKHYMLEILSKNKSRHFKLYLFKIQDILYFDVYPDLSSPSDSENELNILMIPTHVILQVNKTETNLELRFQWFGSYLKRFPECIASTFINMENKSPREDDEIQVITSSTEELQDLLIKIQKIDGIFLDPNGKLYRKRKE